MKKALRRLLEDVKRELLAQRQAAEGNAEESRAERLDAMITGIDHHLKRPPLCLCGHLESRHNEGGRCHAQRSLRGHVSWCDCHELRPVR
jgi:hypothetical protein